jgi:type IV pilus assembly protein PilY1
MTHIEHREERGGRSRRRWRKAVAATLAYSLLLGQIAPTARAASTDISDIPIAVKNRVAPNIMLSLDVSTSMAWETLGPAECCGSRVFPRPDEVAGSIPNFIETNVHNLLTRSSHNNKQFYNPDLTYRPWVNADGTPWPQANPKAALHSPQNPAVGSFNLLEQRTDAASWFSDAGTGDIKIFQCDPDPCGSEHSYWPITYYKYNGSGSIYARTSYTKVEIRHNTPNSTTYTYKLPDGTTATRTQAEEIQNFANWFVYHRSRMASARAGTSRALATLGESPRVGLATTGTGARTIDGVSSAGGIERGVRAFAGADRAAVFDLMFNVPFASQTPLRRLADDVGVYFSRSDALGPWAAQPGVGGAQVSCRQNFHILVTDGGWTTQTARSAGPRANVDGNVGPTHTSTPDPITGAVSTYTYKPASPRQDAWSDTLADVAMYYWVNDLRPDLANNVFTSDNNPAFWQHLSTYTVAFGAFGSLSQAQIDAAFSPTPPANFSWPNPHNSEAARIDDVAHAALNGRGAFFNAADPEEYAIGLATALESVQARTSAAAAVGIGNPLVPSQTNLLFISTYLPGFTWNGELGAYTIDPATGMPSAAPVWQAQAQLDARTHESRLIATHTGNAGEGEGTRFRRVINIESRRLHPAQQSLMDTPGAIPPDGGDVVDYIRGDRSGEESGRYRRRAHLLGDIVNAQAVLVRPPSFGYVDAGYGAFKKDKANRRRIVLQGANDGMLHAFDAGSGTDPGAGAELWAYVPTFVLPHLANLSRRLGYTHKFYVDATPFLGDADFNRVQGYSGSPDWRSIVVGGLGKGGRGYYAIDVTETTAANEYALADKVLWEFPNNDKTHAAVKANVGYSFGRPIVTKTKVGWVVLVTSGYNNGTDPGGSGGDGKGYLFVLNARTGALIRALGTNVGSSNDPSGLAYISGYAENAMVDNTVDYVYGGDLKGNVWRFDLTNANPANWDVKKLATLVDASGNFQPVTTEPELARIDMAGGSKRFVYIGTGMLLGDSDIPGAGANPWASQTQTIYGLVDDLSTNPTITPLRNKLQKQTLNDTGDGTGNRIATSNEVDFSTKKGWYVDLPVEGERITSSPGLAQGALVFTSNIPSADPCILGGTAYFNVLDYRTGGYRVGDPSAPSSVRIPKFGLASGGVLIRTTSGIKAIVRTSSATTFIGSVPKPAGGNVTRRKSWRELLR